AGAGVDIAFAKDRGRFFADGVAREPDDVVTRLVDVAHVDVGVFGARFRRRIVFRHAGGELRGDAVGDGAVAFWFRGGGICGGFYFCGGGGRNRLCGAGRRQREGGEKGENKGNAGGTMHGD